MAFPGFSSVAERIAGPQGLETYDYLMELMLDKTKPGVERTQVEELMATIAFHETGPHQRNWTSAVQEGGPGRGLYQYELGSSNKYPKASGAGRTAMNRLRNLFQREKAMDEFPKWAYKYFDKYMQESGDVDFSELTKEQQDILFMADKLMDPSIGNIAQIGTVSDSTWWARYHHKGVTSDTTGFEDSQRAYKNETTR